MNRILRSATGAALALTWLIACQSPLGESGSRAMAEVRLTAIVVGTPINVLVVTVTAADIPKALVFNLPVQNGVAQGTLRLPPGQQRTIKVEAFDSDANLIADGSATIDVKPGQNPPVSIPVVSKGGQVTIKVTLGPVSVVVQPLTATVPVGATQQLTATITAASGDVLAVPAEWATSNPAIATVDPSGIVTGVLAGPADIVATFAGVAAASQVTVTSAATAASRIAFVSNRDGNFEIYVMNADGTGTVRLTNNGAFDFQPAWSPDGKKIAFTSTRDGNFEIYVMNADGTGPVRLTNNGATDQFPAWSPDGAKIAFASNRDGTSQIYVMNADGTGTVRLTNTGANDQEPAWSPDGNKIAFISDRDGNLEIYVMNVDGTGQVRLTNNGAIDELPAWSPDGAKIAFATNRDGTSQIYVMASSGGNVTRLTNNLSADEAPAWSADGTMIAFTSLRSGSFQIYAMFANGTGEVRLTNSNSGSTLVEDDEPRWRP